MAVTRRIGVLEDPRFLEHRAPPGHPECPERLHAVGAAIAGLGGRLVRLAAEPARDEQILRVHPAKHLERLAEAARRAPLHLDPDTYVSPESDRVARLAAGSTIAAARAVARGELHASFAAVRPPGHHAEAARAMGFCLLNNVAIAARALQAEEGLERILVVDWDVHHGNGTQHLFEEDPSVLYFSTHQFPFYPGTGAFEEAGRGPGLGATVNVPLPAGSGDVELVGAFTRVLVPVARRFRPDAVLVSAGFDAHRDDPLASLEVTGAGFAAVTAVVRAIAEEHCAGRVCAVLEGGYAMSGLREGVSAMLETLLAEACRPPAPPDAPPGSTLRAVLERVAAVHGGRVPELRDR